MASASRVTSPPAAWHIWAIALMKLILVARNELAATLISSAVAMSQRTTGTRSVIGMRVDLLQHLQRLGGVGAEDQPVRPQSVLHRVRLAQELRVPGHLDRVAGRRLRRAAASPAAIAVPTGTVDLPTTRRRLGQQRGQRVDRRVQLGQVGRPARPGRRTQRQEVHIGPVGDLGVVGGEPQPPGAGVLVQQRFQADLEDVRLAGVQRLDPIHVDVHTDDVVAELGHPGRMGRSEIVGADHTYPQSHRNFAQCALRRISTSGTGAGHGLA